MWYVTVRERMGRLVVGALCVVGLLLAGRSTATAQAAADPATTGRVLGQVVVDGTFRALGDAFVSLNDSDVGVRSDSAGAFLMRNVAPGAYMLTVRAVGYDVFRHEITVRAGQEIDVELVLLPVAQVLDTVSASAAAPRRLDVNIAGFEERRAMALGRFVDEKEMADYRGNSLSSLIRSKVPGVTVVRYGGNSVLASGRGAISANQTPGGDDYDKAQGAPRRCYVQLIVNNIVRYGSGTTEQLYSIDKIDPSNVSGIEYYTVSQMPPQFNRGGNAPCGTLVVWLRN